MKNSSNINHMVKEEITKEVGKYFKLNENGNT